jgi:post-segregation antitoxin (ccd killing protein)
MAGFNLEAQYRANLYLEDMSAKNYEIFDRIIQSSPEAVQDLVEFFRIDDLVKLRLKFDEFVTETFVLPAVNGVWGYLKNFSYAIMNPIEDLLSVLCDSDIHIHSHIPSLNDAMWSYIMAGADSGKLTQMEVYCMQAFTSIGNMAIPILASAVVAYFTGGNAQAAKWTGAIMMGIGAFGGSLEACKREGISDGYAYTYSILSAVSELLMEKFVGGIFGPGGGTGFKLFLNSILSEVMEESVQEMIDPFLSDIAAMFDPQYIEGITGFTDGTFDVGLRELFTDPEAYLKRLLTEDFDPQAVMDAGITAAISAVFMGGGKLGTALTSLAKYKNSNIIGLMSILQQDLIKNGYSKTQASLIVSQKLAIFLESGVDINKAVQEAMHDENLKQQYEQWQKDRKAAEDNQSLKDKLFGEEDARGEYDFYNFVLEQVFNEITDGSNSDGSIPSLLEFDIENLL